MTGEKRKEKRERAREVVELEKNRNGGGKIEKEQTTVIKLSMRN